MGANRSTSGPPDSPAREDACVDRWDERDVAPVAAIQGWDVPRMTCELRKVARDSGEDVAAHRGLVKMIPQWERGDRAPRERYRLLYLKVFQDALGGLSQGMSLGTEFVVRLAEVRSRAAS